MQLCRTLHQRRRHRRQLCPTKGPPARALSSSEVISSPSVGSVDPARIFAEVLAEEPVPEVASVASLLRTISWMVCWPPWTNARLSSWRVFKSASRWRSKSPPPSRRRKPKLSPRLRLQARKLRPSRLRSRLFQKKCPSRSSRPLSPPSSPSSRLSRRPSPSPRPRRARMDPGFR